jgi:hypothetical protein
MTKHILCELERVVGSGHNFESAYEELTLRELNAKDEYSLSTSLRGP